LKSDVSWITLGHRFRSSPFARRNHAFQISNTMTKDAIAPVGNPLSRATGNQPCDDRHTSHRLAENVRHFRAINNMTQETLAQRCGIFRTYLSRIETGKGNPSLSVLIALANALEVPPHALLGPIK
jgi:DNA-binding XRE family transcriptional regulator